jgi:hypothetical protein
VRQSGDLAHSAFVFTEPEPGFTRAYDYRAYDYMLRACSRVLDRCTGALSGLDIPVH